MFLYISDYWVSSIPIIIIIAPLCMIPHLLRVLYYSFKHKVVIMISRSHHACYPVIDPPLALD